jgi:hypothetical protein
MLLNLSRKNFYLNLNERSNKMWFNSIANLIRLLFFFDLSLINHFFILIFFLVSTKKMELLMIIVKSR